MILISLLCSCVTYILATNNNTSITQTQDVNINTQDTKDKINLNTASEEELKSLPSIEDKLAIKIIENRPYSSVYDLKKIKGIGDTIINNLKEVVTCN